MDPNVATLLVGASYVVYAAPATVDHWLEQLPWLAARKWLLAAAIAFVGIAAGVVSGGLEQLATGAAFALTLRGVGFGLAAGVLTVAFNALKARQSGGGDAGGTVVPLRPAAPSGDVTPPPAAARTLEPSPWLSAVRGFGIALVASFVLLMLHGCSGAQTGPAVSPRAEARAVVLATTDAVAAAYGACADAASALPDASRAQLKADCAKALDPARQALEVAAPLVDAWNDAAKARVACAVGDALAALQRLELVASDHGWRVPPIVEDGLVLARAFAPTCTTTAAAANADAGADQ